MFKIVLFCAGSSKKFTKEELKQRLTPIQFHVTQEKGTERSEEFVL